MLVEEQVEQGMHGVCTFQTVLIDSLKSDLIRLTTRDRLGPRVKGKWYPRSPMDVLFAV